MASKTEKVLSTGEVRRTQIIAAAVSTFAQRGYYGTTTNEIARAAHLSQAYLYRLFPNKEALFVAVIATVSSRMRKSLKVAIQAARSSDPGVTMHQLLPEALRSLRADPELSAVLIHGNCAAVEPEIRNAVRDCYRSQVDFMKTEFQATDADIQQFVASGLLSNLMFALDAENIHEPWSDVLFSGLS